jgi:hypothetical protein
MYVLRYVGVFALRCTSSSWALGLEGYMHVHAAIDRSQIAGQEQQRGIFVSLCVYGKYRQIHTR